jgi:signal peptidase I
MRLFRKIGSFFLDLVETVVMAMAVFVIIYLFLFQPHQVKGSSMLPNFHDGEYILTDKISYRLKEPQRGDVVVFRAPRNEEYDYIKRIVGLPSDTLKIKNGKIFVNNTPFNESYLSSDHITLPGKFYKEGETFAIPKDQYFVLGDNRSHSSDSREWGLVPKENIVGKAWLRYWPTNRFGVIPEVAFQVTYP